LISDFHRVLNVVCFLVGNSWRLNFICRRFGTLCPFLNVSIQNSDAGNYPEESIQRDISPSNPEHGR